MACNGCGREPAHFFKKRQCDSAGTLEELHDYVVEKDLITAIILGTDFLQLHGAVLDFTKAPVTAWCSFKALRKQELAPPIKPIWIAQCFFRT